MKSIGVYCGSSEGYNPAYIESAKQLGTIIAEAGLCLVYGGSHVGLMAALSDSALAAGGKVVGVITKFLQKKVGHTGLTELHVVKDMHSRKMKMFDLSDAFIALPGGIGTFDEIFEIITWAQLGLHSKPFGFLSPCGYYDKLAGFLDHAIREGFIKPEHRQMFLFKEDPGKLLNALKEFQLPAVEKWINEP